MKRSLQLALAGSVGAMIVSSSAHGALTGLFVVRVTPGTGPPPAGDPRWVYHIFAEFSSTTDRVNTWGGGGNLGTGGIQNILGDNSPGSGFTNIGGGGGQIAPFSSGTSRDYDTYMTVGVRYGNQGPGGLDATILLPGTPLFIGGNTLTFPVSGGGVTVTPNDPQGRADYINFGFDNANRVLLMQLVVNAGEVVRGTIGINWQFAGGPSANSSGMTFRTPPPPPGPGGLGLLAIAALAGRRRRRVS